MATVFVSNYKGFTSTYFTKAITKLSLIKKLQTTKNIYIKPNLTSHVHDDKSGVITADKVLIKVLKAIREINKDATISIIESDGILDNYVRDKFSNRNYEKLIKPFKPIKLVDLTRSEQTSIPCFGSLFKNDIQLPMLFTNDYFYISLSKIKTHSKSTLSGALKNQFGCLPMRDKSVYHPYLSKVIADLNSVINVDLCIAEGCPALEGDGPINGSIKDIDSILIGDDPVAIDTITAKIMGINPKRVAHIKYCHNKNIGTMNLNDINIIGKLPVCTKFMQIKTIKKLSIRFGAFIQKTGQLIAKVGKVVQSQSLLASISKNIKR
ncbi:MAG: DUF362 domain-containing protein [Clostridiales bacterium]|nr:DUF362 domain-containing protein [Clostridiales bacterium]